jgi:hypothetical protein
LGLRGHERNRSLRVFKPTSRVRLFKFWVGRKTHESRLEVKRMAILLLGLS